MEGRASYSETYELTRGYLQNYHKSAQFEDLTLEWLKGFENHLRKRNLGNGTIGMTMRNLPRCLHKKSKMKLLEVVMAELTSINVKNRRSRKRLKRLFSCLKKTLRRRCPGTRNWGFFNSHLTRFSHETERLRNKAFQAEDVVFYFED